MISLAFAALTPSKKRAIPIDHKAPPVDFSNTPPPAPTSCMQVVRPDVFFASGPAGGPFVNGQLNQTVFNNGTIPLDITITSSVSWIRFLDLQAFGPTQASMAITLPPGGSFNFAAVLGPDANALPVGVWAGIMVYINTTTGCGNTNSSGFVTVT